MEHCHYRKNRDRFLNFSGEKCLNDGDMRARFIQFNCIYKPGMISFRFKLYRKTYIVACHQYI